MVLVFFLLLMIRVGRSTEEQIFETKTVGYGQNVTLSCERKKSLQFAELYWIRIVSKNWPEVLGATFSFDYESVNKTPHITTKQEPGAFILHISQTQPSDTGLYYCIKVRQLNMTILTGTFLRTKAVNMRDLQKINTILLLLCAALAFSLIVFAFWIYIIKKKFFTCFNAAGSGQIDFGGQKSQRKHKDMWVYSAVVFTMIKTDVGAIKDAKTAETERIYAAVKALGLDY